MKLKLLQKKGSSLAAMFTAVIIACLGLVQQSQAVVTWLVSDDGTDLTFQTDGGTLNYNLNDWLTAGVADNPSWYSGSGAVFTNQTGTAIYGGGTGARQVSEFGAGVAGYDLPINGAFSSFVSGFDMASGDAFGVTLDSGGGAYTSSRLNLPIGSALSGSVTPITTMTFYGTTVSSVFGSNLDSGPVVIWEDRISGDTVQIGLAPAPITPVDIDIKPGSPENTVNLGSKGLTKVAILGSVDFDATEVDPLSVELADARVRVKGNGQPQTTIQDTNGDGFLDLVLHIDTEGFVLMDGDVSATLTGRTLISDEAIEGEDVVRVVP